MNDYTPIPDDARDDHRLEGLGDDARTFWISVLAIVTHRGRFDARPKAVARALGLEDVERTHALLVALEHAGALHCYTAPHRGGRQAWVGAVPDYALFRGLPDNRRQPSKLPAEVWPGPETEGAAPSSWARLPGAVRSAVPGAAASTTWHPETHLETPVQSAAVTTTRHRAQQDKESKERRGEKEDQGETVATERTDSRTRAREAGRSPSASLAPPNDVASGDGADAPGEPKAGPTRTTPKVPSAPPPQHEPPRGVGVPKHPEAHLDAFDRAFGVQREPERPTLTAEDLAKRKPSVPVPTDETDEEREARQQARIAMLRRQAAELRAAGELP